MSDQAILTLKNICKDYTQGRSVIEVLKNIELTVYAGEMVAIVGASGSGKSTLLHIAGLLDAADAGQVSIAGIEDSKTKNLKYANKIRLENMGFIYQHHHLLRDFTAQENAAMPLLINGMKKSDAMDMAAELLEELGIGKRLFNVPGELSGGEQQRVAIARALINKPQIILADEPTGNLDPHTAEEVFAMFQEHAEKHGASIVMVSHNLELAAKMHKIYKLDGELNKHDM
ncbi:ABC transporter ATP-binding protein [Rickettsiaceae bacterium]|nr:ABC transporter ATP-binding protein [Rickettsiaceae bacterium]